MTSSVRVEPEPQNYMHIQFTFVSIHIVPKWFQADLTELGKNSNSAVPLDKSRSTYDLPWNTNDDLFKIHINPTIPKIPQPVPQVLISQYCAIFTLKNAKTLQNIACVVQIVVQWYFLNSNILRPKRGVLQCSG